MDFRARRKTVMDNSTRLSARLTSSVLESIDTVNPIFWDLCTVSSRQLQDKIEICIRRVVREFIETEMKNG